LNDPPPTPAFIALGANLGDRAGNIHIALAQLAATPGVLVQSVSSLLENPAVGGPPDSPPFLNAAAQIAATVPPRALLDRLLEIESAMGRVRRQLWAPRPIDLDLLLYGQQVLDQPGLTLPHPRLHQRRFVLQPLAEIAPRLLHPTLNKSIQALLDELPPDA
jgi:2-amino-4-hydroxy-6-hydroxymethyldihydropteridine diphosphokinase